MSIKRIFFQGSVSGNAHVHVNIPYLYIAMPDPGPSHGYYFHRRHRITKQYLDNPVIDKLWFMSWVQSI